MKIITVLTTILILLIMGCDSDKPSSSSPNIITFTQLGGSTINLEIGNAQNDMFTLVDTTLKWDNLDGTVTFLPIPNLTIKSVTTGNNFKDNLKIITTINLSNSNNVKTNTGQIITGPVDFDINFLFNFEGDVKKSQIVIGPFGVFDPECIPSDLSCGTIQ